MANGVDESAFLGSSVSEAPTAPANEESKERVKAKTDKRRDTHAILAPAVKTLRAIIANQIKKERDVEVVRERAQKRAKADGSTSRDALADEMLYSAGRLDAFNEIEQLYDAAEKLKGLASE